jgi:hypothetical protein
MKTSLFYWVMSHMKGGENMMAMFFAQRVIIGKTAYKDVPATLKPQLAEILKDNDLKSLIEE